jgi:hypothetical protein
MDSYHRGMSYMYCNKCGKKNEDEAKFCSACGASLTGERVEIGKHYENRCDEECSGKDGHSGIWVNFWIVVIVIVIIGIIFSIILKILETSWSGAHLPAWLVNFSYWDVCGLLVALAFMVLLLNLLLKAVRRN